MQVYECKPINHPLDATVTLPGSKSITNRALIVAALADGNSVLTDALLAEDTRLMIDVLRALGIAITVDEAECAIEVTGCGGHLPASEADLFCGNAGTVMRFCAAMAATAVGTFRLDGVARMRERPIGGLVEMLRALGAGVEYAESEGFPPIVVRASGLRGGHVGLESPESSQHVSALLLAAPYAMRDVMIEVTGGLPSAPYVKMTSAVMYRFDVGVLESYTGDGARLIVAAPQRYQAKTFAVEPDASNATYFLAAAAIAGGRVTVTGLGTDSIQGDIGFAATLQRMGCSVERSPSELTVVGPQDGKRLQGIDVDLGDMPDTAQTLAVLSLFAEGPTTIQGVANLRVKETDRLAALRTELTKLGATVELMPEGMRIDPPAEIRPAAIDTYDDHRMAMSFALVGLRQAGIAINNPDCCGKTFPDFFDRFERMTAAQR